MPDNPFSRAWRRLATDPTRTRSDRGSSGHDLAPPDWWRGQIPKAEKVWVPETVVISGQTNGFDPAVAPLTTVSLREVRFDRAHVVGADIPLDELGLSVMWSEFEDCTIHQRSRRLHSEGAEPQGSLGHRPSVYRRCLFRGVRFRLRAGFSVGEARFENCVFDRCRFEEHFSFCADYVECRFIGKIRTAVFYGRAPVGVRCDGRTNEIRGNDFTEAIISDNVGWRRDIDVDAQQWPRNYKPVSDR